MITIPAKSNEEERDGKRIIQFSILVFLLLPGFLFAQTPAFPGAEGFGAMTTGGRGGAVIMVTNLNDYGQGSLRSAIQASGPRTIIFRVSGTIELESELRINNGNITIAGQTAPGDGICIRNFPLIIDADNVIIRFIRSRHGDQTGSQNDAMFGREQQNIIIDHCSMSWSVDECGSFYDNKNFSLQYCLLSESLYSSIHDKGNHGYGGIWGGQGASFHHNLLAHHSSRNPRFNGSRYSGEPTLELVDYRNNVIYNWGSNSAYGGEAGNHNIVANYYKYGPATAVSKRDRIVEPYSNENGFGTYYIAGNVTEGYPATTDDNWLGVDGITLAEKELIKLENPLEAPALTPHNAAEAFEHVMSRAGAILPKRDPIDARIICETVTGTAQYGGNYAVGQGIIDSQGTVGGWPILESTPPPDDTDKDGMPDDWEDANGLNKNDPADRNGDDDGDGYTNLEAYLNELVEAYEYLVRPIKLSIDTVIDYAVTLSWVDISENETGFVVERKKEDSWNELITTEPDSTTFTDNSLTDNGVYYYRLKTVNTTMESFYTDSIFAELKVGMESAADFGENLEVFPNPFSNKAKLRFSLSVKAVVSISLYDMTGRQVRQIFHGEQHSGTHSLIFQAEELNSGPYIIRFETGNEVDYHRVIIAR
ncbi:MAG: T9SS type A sorting domain-containing protein [Bacteroidales bacterium]